MFFGGSPQKKCQHLGTFGQMPGTWMRSLICSRWCAVQWESRPFSLRSRSSHCRGRHNGTPRHTATRRLPMQRTRLPIGHIAVFFPPFVNVKFPDIFSSRRVSLFGQKEPFCSGCPGTQLKIIFTWSSMDTCRFVEPLFSMMVFVVAVCGRHCLFCDAASTDQQPVCAIVCLHLRVSLAASLDVLKATASTHFWNSFLVLRIGQRKSVRCDARKNAWVKAASDERGSCWNARDQSAEGVVSSFRWSKKRTRLDSW